MTEEELKVIAEMLGGLVWKGKVHVLAPSPTPGTCRDCSVRASHKGGCGDGLGSKTRCAYGQHYQELKT